MYSIDIYRTDDAILIHDKPGGWKRALPGLVFCLGFGVLLAWMTIGAALEGAVMEGVVVGSLMGGCNIFLLFYVLWRINGHTTVLIDRDSIRYEWWCFWGNLSRIYPRPETIKAETAPSTFFVGGLFSVAFRISKKWWQNKHMFLPTAAERHWLFTELARFQEEVPTAQPIDDKRPVWKGSFTESESGMNVLQTLDWRGQYFRRVVPKSESVPEEKSQQGTPGILSLRCAKCHKIVPRECVLPDKPIAHCPDCGCVFEPQELLRKWVRGGEWAKKSRLNIRRDADALEITQKPLRTGLPLWCVLLFALFDIGMVACYLFIQQLCPNENVFEIVRPEDAGEILYFFTLTHFVILPPALWAFFDRRTIRLDRETLQITGRWLFIPWRRTVSRLHVKKASFGELHSLLYNLKLAYCNRSVWIGCTTREEIETLRGEINHFLYTVEPAQLEMASGDWEPAFLGGTESFDPEIVLHCPDCGTRLEVGNRPPGGCVGDSRLTFHCHSCNADFPIDQGIAYRIEAIPGGQPESIALERTDDSLTMRYVPNFSKWVLYGNVVAGWFCILMFVGMFAFSVVLMFQEGKMSMIGLILMSVLCFVPFILFIVWLYFMVMQESNTFYCDWIIHLDTNEARFDIRCKKRCKTIVIPREKIIEARINEDTKGFKKLRFGYFPEFLECRDGVGGHFLLDDGTKHYLPLGSVDQRKVREVTNWMLATLNGFLAEHPRSAGYIAVFRQSLL